MKRRRLALFVIVGAILAGGAAYALFFRPENYNQVQVILPLDGVAAGTKLAKTIALPRGRYQVEFHFSRPLDDASLGAFAYTLEIADEYLALSGEVALESDLALSAIHGRQFFVRRPESVAVLNVRVVRPPNVGVMAAIVKDPFP